MDNSEYELKEKDYESIMDGALDYFKRDPIRFADKASLCKSYVKAVLQFTKANRLVIDDGTIRKKSDSE